MQTEQETEKRREQAKDTAVAYLAHRMHTRAEVQKRLAERGFSAEEIAETLDDLTELGYLSDKDYAEAYLAYALQKRHGLPRIREELVHRGVDRDTIEDAFYHYYKTQEEDGMAVASEAERAEREALRVAAGQEIDDKLIAKIGRRLKTLGYESSAVYRAVGTVMRMKHKGDGDFED